MITMPSFSQSALMQNHWLIYRLWFTSILLLQQTRNCPRLVIILLLSWTPGLETYNYFRCLLSYNSYSIHFNHLSRSFFTSNVSLICPLLLQKLLSLAHTWTKRSTSELLLLNPNLLLGYACSNTNFFVCLRTQNCSLLLTISDASFNPGLCQVTFHFQYLSHFFIFCFL